MNGCREPKKPRNIISVIFKRYLIVVGNNLFHAHCRIERLKTGVNEILMWPVVLISDSHGGMNSGEF